MSQTKVQLVSNIVGNVSGGASFTGIVTATSFVGDGTNLTNTGATLSAASGSQRLVVTSGTSGVMTSVGTDADLSWDSTTNTLSSPTFSGNITGVAATFTGNVSIAGTLTYEDVTNVDAIGVVTARSGIVLGPTANTIRLGTGTTISSPSSNTFTVLTNGSDRIIVGSNGNAIFRANNANTTFSIGNISGTTTVLDTTTPSAVGVGGRIVFGSTYFTGGNTMGAAYIGSFKENAPDNGTSEYNHSLTFGTSSGAGSGFIERARISSTGGFSVGTTANPGTGAIYATGDITAFYSSDIRLKKDIEPISEPIKKLMEISGVTYRWNEEYLKDKDVDGYFVRETEVGVIAQEVEKVLPEVVATRENGYKAVRYEKLVALLIEAVKDQQHQIDELKARLEEK